MTAQAEAFCDLFENLLIELWRAQIGRGLMAATIINIAAGDLRLAHIFAPCLESGPNCQKNGLIEGSN